MLGLGCVFVQGGRTAKLTSARLISGPCLNIACSRKLD